MHNHNKVRSLDKKCILKKGEAEKGLETGAGAGADAEKGKASPSVNSNINNSHPSRLTNWRSIYVASVISFVGSAQFSLYFSSLWPYLQIIDRTTNENFFGLIIAVYSLGQVRLPLYIGLLMMFIGNACYIGMEVVVVMPKRHFLLIGRFITGAGSGNVSLLRTYASTASTSADRQKAIAYVTMGQALGITAGPALQLFFTTLSYPGVSLPFGLSFNLYTAPAYLALAMNAFGAVALHFLFTEEYAGLEERSLGEEEGESQSCADTTTTTTKQAKSKHHNKLPPYDVLAVVVCYLTRFTQMFISTNLETIGSPFAMMNFGWTETKAVIVTSAVQGAVGLLTLITYVAYIALQMEKVVNFRVSCILSIIALCLFHLITYSWPFLSGHVHTYNSTSDWALSKLDSAEEPVGCNSDKFQWCATLAPVNVWLYYSSYIIFIGLAFPTLNISMTTLFSKLLGPRRQGTHQGVLQMSGGVARMIGPILMSLLYSGYGPTMAWNMEILVILITLVLWIIFYGRLVPLRLGNEFHASTSTTITTMADSMKVQKKGRVEV